MIIIPMELIVSGGWFGREGLYEVELKRILYPSDLREVSGRQGFLIVSYDLTARTLDVPVKRSDFPPLVFAETGEVKPFVTAVGSATLRPTGASLSSAEFCSRIHRVKNYIERGDVYQINLTCGFGFKLAGDPKDLFAGFFSRQPVPFAFFMDTGDFFLLSGSMELFLRKEGSRIESKPVKGTGRTPAEILRSEKERAENLMITDMMRNDIGKVAETGSVRVRELFKVERYRTLCQMHSTVEGRTCRGIGEILKETFPPASVTGAPKRRAVEIIEELEPHSRGYYCGTAGFVSGEGDFVLSVLIRTAYGIGQDITYFAGCGIVWDSDPLREIEELKLKVKAFYGGDITAGEYLSFP